MRQSSIYREGKEQKASGRQVAQDGLLLNSVEVRSGFQGVAASRSGGRWMRESCRMRHECLMYVLDKPGAERFRGRGGFLSAAKLGACLHLYMHRKSLEVGDLPLIHVQKLGTCLQP